MTKSKAAKSKAKSGRKKGGKKIPLKNGTKNKRRKKSIVGKKINAWQWKWIAGVMLFGFIIFFPSLQSQFINYDDNIYITDNPFIINFSIDTLTNLFSSFYQNQYAPVAMMLMSIEYQLFSDPVGFKLWSVLLHLFNGFLVFKVINGLFGKWEYAFVVMLLFITHPMQVESVTWTTASMKVGLFTAFFLGSLWAYLKFLENGKQYFFLISFGLFALSCLSKEQAIALSVVLIILDYVKGRSLLNRKVLIEKIPFFILSMIVGIITLKASSGMDTTSSIVQYSILERIFFACYSVAAYWLKVLLPTDLNLFYMYPVKSGINWAYKLSPIFVLGIGYWLISALRKDNRIVVFGIAFFFANLGLTLLSQILATRDVMMADRYVYLPIVGLFLLMVHGLDFVGKRFRVSRNWIVGGLATYVVFLGLLTFQRTKVWQNSITLFTDVIEKAEAGNKEISPFLSMAFNNRGIAYKNNNQIALAEADYRRAMEVNPSDHKSYGNLGNIYFLNGKYMEAITEYNKALEIRPKTENTLSSRGAAYASISQWDQALLDVDNALEINPYLFDGLKNRAFILYNLQRIEEAIPATQKYLQVRNTDAGMVNLLGLLYFQQGNNELALTEMNRSIQIDPGQAAFYYNRALVYQALGNRNAMIQDARMAQSKGYTVPAELLR